MKRLDLLALRDTVQVTKPKESVLKRIQGSFWEIWALINQLIDRRHWIGEI